MSAVIVENDVSIWDDECGAVYHFPKRYSSVLTPGTQVVYYKGKQTDKAFAASRLSPAPHYFGIARIGSVYADKKSTKGDLFALIEDFQRFESAVIAKEGSDYLEPIPPSKAQNYWRNGVRKISSLTYEGILSRAKFQLPLLPEVGVSDDSQDFLSSSEGNAASYYGVRYERDRKLRLQAIAIHGLGCMGCGFNFELAYGEYAKGYIHVHHTQPISEYGGSKAVSAQADLITLCANCHAVVHRKRDKTLSLDDLKRLIRGKWVPL